MVTEIEPVDAEDIKELNEETQIDQEDYDAQFFMPLEKVSVSDGNARDKYFIENQNPKRSYRWVDLDARALRTMNISQNISTKWKLMTESDLKVGGEQVDKAHPGDEHFMRGRLALAWAPKEHLELNRAIQDRRNHESMIAAGNVGDGHHIKDDSATTNLSVKHNPEVHKNIWEARKTAAKEAKKQQATLDKFEKKSGKVAKKGS
jgi:hypothetical protein